MMSGYAETSMAAVFLNRVDQYGEKPCIAFKRNGRYTDLSWNRMGEMVKDLASFLIVMGIQKGDRIALFSPNRYEWWVSDLAALSIGATDVPVYASNSSEEAFFILDHSGARACFVGEQQHLEKVLEIRGRLPHLEFIVVFDPAGLNANNVFYFSHALEIGRDRDNRDEFDTRFNAIRSSEPATIIYTSGTTGPPKGMGKGQK